MLLASTFEDLWPSRDQLPDVLEEIAAFDLVALCRRDPPHGARQLSGMYADLATRIEATLWKVPGMAKAVGDQARGMGLPWLGRRALSEFAIWLEADPPAGGTRPEDEAAWEAMPASIADRHTSEGRRQGTLETILSGTPRGHVALMSEVGEIGRASGARSTRSRGSTLEPASL